METIDNKAESAQPPASEQQVGETIDNDSGQNALN